jgi:hypothetical protein
MPATVIVNNLTVVHKSSNGMSVAFPDVCKTPTPGGPVPIPYPNIAMSSDTASGSSTVKVDGNPIMLKSSHFAMSSGDEAGSAMGVASNKIKGKAYPKMYSFDVKVDGENVFRLSDIMLQNGGSPTNTPPATLLQPNIVVIPGTNKDKKPELTRLAWDVNEAACGDEVGLSIETNDVDDGFNVPVRIVRSTKGKPFESLSAEVSGNKSTPKWISRRGAWTKTVELTALQKVLKGHKKSSNKLKMKAVGDVPTEIVGPNTRVTPQYTQVIKPWWNVLLLRPRKVWAPTGANYSWNYYYELMIKKGELIVTRKVNFDKLPGANPSKGQLKQWAREIENIWDRKFKIHRAQCKRGDHCNCSPASGCCSFTIRVRCKFQPGPGERVVLHPGSNNPNDWGGPDWWYSHTWWMGMAGVPVTVRAHEFGHLMGLYDEYPAGACDPGRVVTNDPSSIMNAGTKTYDRHFREFHQWFDGKANGVIGATKLVRM